MLKLGKDLKGYDMIKGENTGDCLSLALKVTEEFMEQQSGISWGGGMMLFDTYTGRTKDILNPAQYPFFSHVKPDKKYDVSYSLGFHRY